MSMPAPSLNNDSLKNSLIISTGIHAVLLLLLIVGLPHLMPPLPAPRQPVPFEIVDISELTNTRVKDPEQKPPVPEPKPQPRPEQAAPPPEQKPQPPQPQTAAPKEEVEGLKAAAKTPLQKPKPVEAKPQTNDFSKLLKNLEVKKPEAQKTPDMKADAKTPAQPATAQASALSDRLTISEEDALRRQIEQCWNPPIGARDADKLIVQVIIDVNPDRTVMNAEVVDKMRYASDSFFRAAADSAIRALRNPRCTPLQLPPDKYDQWKRIDFNFDPRDML